MTKRTRLITTVTVAAVVALAGLGFVAGTTPSAPTRAAIKRSMPNGRTDVIKAMGNTKWADIELKG